MTTAFSTLTDAVAESLYGPLNGRNGASRPLPRIPAKVL